MGRNVMPRITESFDPNAVEWRKVVDPTETDFLVDFEYSLLGYDYDCGRLDMLLRFKGNGGHCRRHRHIASTVTLILEGEQHITEVETDGSTTSIVRKKGEYARASADAMPHLERGGPDGCTLMLSMVAPDGRLFEYYGQDMESVRILTIEQYVKSWERGTVPGAVKTKSAAAA
tara:strand:+ start:13528 stop:14049 length:522 start_codon:yes stop_codon:yes gene_type:complete